MNNLVKVNVLLKDPDGIPLANHPFVVKLSSADSKGVLTVDNPVFAKTTLSGKAVLELKPSNNHYYIEYSLKANRIPKIFKFLVTDALPEVDLVNLIVDTTTDTNDVSVLLAELREIKKTVLEYMGNQPALVKRIEAVERALIALDTNVASHDTTLTEVLSSLAALRLSYDGLKLVTEDLERIKADKFLFYGR